MNLLQKKKIKRNSFSLFWVIDRGKLSMYFCSGKV